jgi:hypothetical protein
MVRVCACVCVCVLKLSCVRESFQLYVCVCVYVCDHPLQATGLCIRRAPPITTHISTCDSVISPMCLDSCLRRNRPRIDRHSFLPLRTRLGRSCVCMCVCVVGIHRVCMYVHSCFLTSPQHQHTRKENIRRRRNTLCVCAECSAFHRILQHTLHRRTAAR